MAMGGEKLRRRRRSADEWRAVLGQFKDSGLTEAAFCASACVSVASLQRWRRLLDGDSGRSRCGDAAAGFVDLGLIEPARGTAAPSRLELTLDLGGGVVLHLARG